jgi:hypothetical protein
VVDSLGRWLPEHRESTVAVLVPRNQRGAEVIEALKRKGLEYIEFLSSTTTTRAAAGALSQLIIYLADPQSASKLSKAYQVWRRDWQDNGASQLRRKRGGRRDREGGWRLSQKPAHYRHCPAPQTQ